MISVIWACGGEAIIDGPLGTGGSDSSSTTTTGMSVAVSTSTGASGVRLNCQLACSTLTTCGLDDTAECEERCDENVVDACVDEHDTWLACSLAEVNSLCGSVPSIVCGPELQAYVDCAGSVVGAEACGLGPDGCFCEGFVSPGVVLSQQCQNGEGCRCSVGGQVVGTCEPDDSVCGILQGCCAGLFFVAP